MCEGGRWCEEGGLAFTPNGGHHGGLVAMVTGMGGVEGGKPYKMVPRALWMHQAIISAFKPTHSTPGFNLYLIKPH